MPEQKSAIKRLRKESEKYLPKLKDLKSGERHVFDPKKLGVKTPQAIRMAITRYMRQGLLPKTLTISFKRVKNTHTGKTNLLVYVTNGTTPKAPKKVSKPRASKPKPEKVTKPAETKETVAEEATIKP